MIQAQTVLAPVRNIVISGDELMSLSWGHFVLSANEFSWAYIKEGRSYAVSDIIGFLKEITKYEGSNSEAESDTQDNA